MRRSRPHPKLGGAAFSATARKIVALRRRPQPRDHLLKATRQLRRLKIPRGGSEGHAQAAPARVPIADRLEARAVLLVKESPGVARGDAACDRGERRKRDQGCKDGLHRALSLVPSASAHALCASTGGTLAPHSAPAHLRNWHEFATPFRSFPRSLPAERVGNWSMQPRAGSNTSAAAIPYANPRSRPQTSGDRRLPDGRSRCGIGATELSDAPALG